MQNLPCNGELIDMDSKDYLRHINELDKMFMKTLKRKEEPSENTYQGQRLRIERSQIMIKYYQKIMEEMIRRAENEENATDRCLLGKDLDKIFKQYCNVIYMLKQEKNVLEKMRQDELNKLRDDIKNNFDGQV